MIAWPASALLTGNGVALILRVPGTEHGDWFSMRGWYVFAATAALAVLSKYVIRSGDRPLFNPSNLGLVVTFLVLGARFADPQDLWWGPMSLGSGADLRGDHRRRAWSSPVGSACWRCPPCSGRCSAR